MKKYLFIIAFLSAFVTQAQVNLSPTTFNPTGAVLNATVDTLNLTMSGNYNAVMTIQTLLTRTSGTIAGTVRLYGSNYNNVAGAWEPVGDTLTLTNAATNKHTWTISQPAYKYYQVLQSGGTTMAGVLTGKVLGIRPN